MAAPQVVRCDNCPFWRGRHTTPEAERVAAAAGHPLPRGQCRRFPEIVPKHEEDWCGEHPTLTMARVQRDADAIAWAVSEMLAARGLRNGSENGAPAKKDR